jgi:alpha,alpha-trehalose phosphorylase (configuration-retaining)
MGEFRALCAKERSNELAWPARQYIIQVARFDPSKGIPSVIESYFKFRKLLEGKVSDEEAPQLLICGHGAVDDPDASIIFDQTVQQIYSEPFNEFAKDIVAMRLPPSDQRTHFLVFVR